MEMDVPANPEAVDRLGPGTQEPAAAHDGDLVYQA